MLKNICSALHQQYLVLLLILWICWPICSNQYTLPMNLHNKKHPPCQTSKQTNQYARVVKREGVDHLSPNQFREELGMG